MQKYLDKEWLFRLDDGEVQTRQEIELEKVTELKENQVFQKEAEKARSREEKAQERAARLSDQLRRKKVTHRHMDVPVSSLPLSF